MAVFVEPVNHGGICLEFTGNRVVLKGMLDDENPGVFMEPFIDKVHDSIIEQGLKSITIDITELAYLNSSAIKEIVYWVLKQKNLTDQEVYTITFLCNSQFLWQESSISTIIFLNPDYIKKEII